MSEAMAEQEEVVMMMALETMNALGNAVAWKVAAFASRCFAVVDSERLAVA